MIKCIKCERQSTTSLCADCASQLVDTKTPTELAILARVGLIALVDEATSYQKERLKDDLARIKERLS